MKSVYFYEHVCNMHIVPQGGEEGACLSQEEEALVKHSFGLFEEEELRGIPVEISSRHLETEGMHVFSMFIYACILHVLMYRCIMYAFCMFYVLCMFVCVLCVYCFMCLLCLCIVYILCICAFM